MSKETPTIKELNALKARVRAMNQKASVVKKWLGGWASYDGPAYSVLSFCICRADTEAEAWQAAEKYYEKQKALFEQED